jgi:hypothetical protein
MGVGGLLSLVALVCGIMVVVKMIQNKQTALGVISLILMFCTGIGHLIALIYGWMKSSEWNIKGLMMAYTASLIVGTVLVGAGYGIMISKIVKEVQNNPEFQQQMQQFEMPEVEVE